MWNGDGNGNGNEMIVLLMVYLNRWSVGRDVKWGCCLGLL